MPTIAIDPRAGRRLFAGAVVLGAALGCGGARDRAAAPAPAAAGAGAPLAVASMDTIELRRRGLTLFQQQCAICHGIKGRGDGPAAPLLHPKPRDYASGQFRLTSTASGLPSDDDLQTTLRRGMPGSAMPAWDHLPDTDLDALVLAVRDLATEGRIARLLADDPALSPVEARALATTLLAPGPPVVVPPAIAATAGMRVRGRALYTEHCARCHDADGRGRLATDLRDAQGDPNLARDFTQGIFKGPSDPAAIAQRIVRGMPGSAMPETSLPAEDLWAIVHRVREFVPAHADDRVRLDRRTLRATRAPAPLTTAVAAAAWRAVTPVFIPVVPLRWRADRIAGVQVQALHDGTHVALRLQWDDGTRNDAVDTPAACSDGVAVQLGPLDPAPPLLAKGSAGAPVSLWSWKAARSDDPARGAHPEPSGHQPERSVTGRATGGPLARPDGAPWVESCSAAGLGTLATRGSAAQEVDGGAAWAGGRWTVVLRRALDPGAAAPGDVACAPGRPVAVAIAAWDGHAGDRDGQKCVSVWHRLELMP